MNTRTKKSGIKPARPERPELKIIPIRIEPADYARLQEIAYARGTQAASLVRGAIKEIIREADGNGK